jgi:hypothetical protein
MRLAAIIAVISSATLMTFAAWPGTRIPNRSTSHVPIEVPSDTEEFEAVGYLMADSGLQIGGYDLATIALDGGGAVEIKRHGADRGRFYKCPGGKVTRDTLNLSCPGTPLGTVSVQGKLVDEDGHLIGNGVRYNQYIMAKVTCRRGARALFSRVVRFVFTFGD